MLSFLTRPIDRLAMWTAARSIPRRTLGPHRAAEAEALVRQPDFFHAPPPAPDAISFTDKVNFMFSSTVQTPWTETNRVYGKFYPAGPDWRRQPGVVLLHGWNGEGGYHWQFPLLARWLNRAGLNAGMIELSYHGRRKPRSPGSIRNFISPDLLRVAEAVRQSLADVRSLVGWMLHQGSPSVGVWGFSLGAWLAGLLAARDPRIAFAVLLTPVVRMDKALLELPFCEPIRRSLAGVRVRLDPLNLISHPPPPRERILIIEALHDLFAPPETVEELWRAWGEPEIWRFRHGHISILMSLPILSRAAKWIMEKAAKTG